MWIIKLTKEQDKHPILNHAFVNKYDFSNGEIGVFQSNTIETVM